MPRSTKVLLEAEGIEEVKRLLSGQTSRAAKNIAKRFFVAFAGTVRNDLRAAVESRTGNLKRAIKSKSTSSGGAKVYAEKPKGAHAHIVRKGTGPRKTKGGLDRGAMPPNKRMQAVLDGAQQKFKAEVTSRVSAELRKEAEKALRK